MAPARSAWRDSVPRSEGGQGWGVFRQFDDQLDGLDQVACHRAVVMPVRSRIDHQNRIGAHRPGRQDVRLGITDHERMGQLDAEVGARPLEESGPRFATAAACLRRMEAGIDVLDLSADAKLAVSDSDATVRREATQRVDAEVAGAPSDPAFDRRRELVGLVFKEVERVISYGLPG